MNPPIFFDFLIINVILLQPISQVKVEEFPYFHVLAWYSPWRKYSLEGLSAKNNMFFVISMSKAFEWSKSRLKTPDSLKGLPFLA